MNWAWNYLTFQRGTRLITGVSGARMEDMQTEPGSAAAGRSQRPEAQRDSATVSRQ